VIRGLSFASDLRHAQDGSRGEIHLRHRFTIERRIIIDGRGQYPQS
jgi:hypothetical protein